MKVPFDVMTDFMPAATIGVSTAVICVPPSLPPDTLADLVKYAGAHPGRISDLNPGNGTGGHLIPEMLRVRHGVDVTSISCKGLPPSIQDLVAGRIELGIISTSLALPHAKAGRLKAIAIVGSQRIADLPEVATMAEQGFGDMEVRSSLPLYGPPGLPTAIVERLNRSVAKALVDPEAQRRLASVHIEPTPMSTPVLAAALHAEHDRLGKLISGLGIKADGGG